MKKKIIITLIASLLVLSIVIISIIQIENSKSNILRDESLSFKVDLDIPRLIPFQKDNNWGFYNRSKTIVIEPKYEWVKFPHYFYYSDKYFIVEYNGLWGVIDSLGEKIVPFIYDDLDFIENSSDKFIAQKGDDFGIINLSNEVLIPFRFKELSMWGKYFFAEDKKNYGYLLLNNKGGKVLDNLYYWQDKTQDRIFIITKEIKATKNYLPWRETKQVLGCVGIGGNIVLPLKYTGVEINDRFFIVSDYDPQKITKVHNELYGVCDKNGIEIIPIIYDRVNYYKKAGKTVFACYKENKVKVVDSLNQTIIPYRYNYIYNIINKNNNIYIFAMNNYLYGVLNLEGEVTVPFEYTSLVDRKNTGIIAAKKNMKAGFIDYDNNILIPFEYEDVSPFSEGFALVKIISPDYIEGNLRVDGKSEASASEFSDYVGQGKLYTKDEFYNGMKNLVFRENFYEKIKNYDKRFGSFEEFDLCMTLGNWRKKIPGKYGFIDTKGKIRINLIYDEAKDFKDGYAEVCFNNKWGVINKNGKVVIPIKYSKISRTRYKDLFEIYNYDKFIGYIDTNGVEYFNEKFAL